jgi:Na+/melibiose symporter-like transporter
MKLAISMPRATDTSFFNNHVTTFFLLLTLLVGIIFLILIFKQNYEHFKLQLQQEKEVKFQKVIKKEFRNSSLVCLIILLIMILLIVKIGFN